MWTTLATSIFSLFVGAVPGIVREIAQAKVDLANTETERERIATEERIKALEAKRDVLIANSTTPWDAVFRATVIAPFAIYIAWTVAWDKIACKWFMSAVDCTTDPLAPWQTQVLAVLLAYLFVTDITKVFKK
jgi:hypothetical protein